MQSYLNSFNATLNSQWDGTRPPVAFGTELLSANDNISLKGILAANALTKVETELNALAKLGVQEVTTAVAFPILYQPFYQYNGDPLDYAKVLSFYQNVMAQARQRGMRVLIESPVVFPQFATDLPLKAYYATLSEAELTAGRAQVAQIIAQQLQPDWLNLGSEPDTQAALVGMTSEYSPQQWAADISTIVTQLRNAGIKGKPLIGAGCGAWQQSGSQYVQALVATDIDYFDLHIFAVNNGYLEDGASYLEAAIAAGKGAAISEAWDHKVTDAQLKGQSEFGLINVLSSVEPYNGYSFGDTQDAEFIQEMIELAYAKKLYYVSFFESEIFFAYLNYSQVSGVSGTQLITQEMQAATSAMATGTFSPLGAWFSKAINPTAPVTISSASGTAPLAPASIVSIYGTKLATGSGPATTLPLPTNLEGTTATLTDADGTQTALPLFFVSPLQINAEIPATAAAGPGVIAIHSGAGDESSAVILNPAYPSLFAANQDGKGIAAAQVVTNDSNGKQVISYVYNYPCQAGDCAAVPIDLSIGNTALVLYGTGIRGATSLAAVTVQIGTLTLAPFYAGPVANDVGLDQVNVSLPQSLAGNGAVNVTVTVDGAMSNGVTVDFK